MRLALEHLDLKGLAIDLPSLLDAVNRRILVRSTAELKGSLEQTPSSLRLTGVTAARTVLDALSLQFGSVQLSAVGETSFVELRAGYERKEMRTELELEAQSVHAAELLLKVSALQLHGETRMRGMRLSLQDGAGRLSFEEIKVVAFRLTIGELTLSAADLTIERLLIEWGAGGFRLEAAACAAPLLELSTGSLSLSARDAAVHNVSVRDGYVGFRAATMAHAKLAAAFEAPTPAVSPKRAALPVGTKQSPRVFDFRSLDGLEGRLHVDAAVDMTVPIIGRRLATHKLRLPVEDGSVDYRELEADLAALEESMLDFSVRDGALVLERGIPLLPTRGLGKPLLMWDLGPDDLALAQRRRVRLSVLPQVRLADAAKKSRDEDEQREAGGSSFALRRLSLENIDVSFALHAVDHLDSAIRKLSFERLMAHGAVHHLPDGGARDGEIRGEIHGLETTLVGLVLGTRALDIGLLYMGRLAGLLLSFEGLRPTKLSFDIEKLALTNAELSTNPVSASVRAPAG